MNPHVGHAQGLPTSNQDFLRAIFGNSWYRAHVTGFDGNPGKPPPGVWAGGAAGQWILKPDQNNYFAVSLFTSSARRASDFEKLILLGVDDVGQKVGADQVWGLLGDPTFRIETSPGNEQWGYVLEHPITSEPVATALIHALAKALNDNDARDVTRYLRLPVGVNQKPSAGGFRVRLVELTPGKRLEGSALARLGLTLSVDMDGGPSPKVVPGPGALTRRSYDDLAERDRWFRAMRKLDLVVGGPRNSAMGRCYDVVCPWHDEHTGRATTGTAYVPVVGRFECHHGHCAGRTGEHLPTKLDAMLKDASGGTWSLIDEEFDDLPDAPASAPSSGSRTPLSDNPGADIVGADPTEDGLARAFRDRYHERLRFNRTTGHWHLWDTHTWAPDGDHVAFTWARQVTRDFRASLDRDIRALGKIAAAAAIERAARNDPRISIRLDQFDPDPLHAGTPAGTLELATGTVTLADPRQLISKRLTVAPASPGTSAPVWDRFIWDTFAGDIELIEFTHRWFGYCLSGDVSAEVFAFLYGTGGNGKGVLLHTISAIAGDYAWKIDARVLMRRKDEGHETDIAQLAGRRMVVTSELPDGQSFNLTRLKNLTGNEGTIGARYMRKDHFQFAPVHKLTLVGNHKPHLDHTDEAVRRRLVLIPFLHRPPSPDPTLKARLVPEYPAILRRLVDGGAEVHAALASGKGFSALVPASVNAASQEYLIEQNAVALWVRERCCVDVNGAVVVSEGFEDFQRWCAAENQTHTVSARTFGQSVERAAEILGLSVVSRRTKHGMVLHGIRTNP